MPNNQDLLTVRSTQNWMCEENCTPINVADPNFREWAYFWCGRVEISKRRWRKVGGNRGLPGVLWGALGLGKANDRVRAVLISLSFLYIQPYEGPFRGLECILHRHVSLELTVTHDDAQSSICAGLCRAQFYYVILL